MSYVVKNNAESTVADSPLAQAAVTLNVAAGGGANFPSTFPFLITLWDDVTYPDPTDDSGMEIVKCTARTTDAMTIVRAQEGTADVAHANAERVAMLITAGIIDELIAEVVEDTSPQLGGTLDCNSKQIRESKGIDVASATALTLGTDGNYYDVTGTATITSIAAIAVGTVITLHFDAILILTHHADNLILPGAANITTAAGDEAIFREYAAGDWRCICYMKASGAAIVGGDPLIAKSLADIATDINGASTNSIPASYFNILFAIADTALICNSANLTAAKNASIFNEAGFSAANKALVFNEAGFSVANKALVFNEAGFSAANKALVFNEAGFSVANKALVFNEAGFSVANKALVCREAGLSIANINAIIIHANITDDNAQQILSEITKANRDLTSAANIYEILDDWNDNKLTARDGAGTTSTGFTNLFAHKDKFRPEWTIANGTPAAAGGILSIPAGNVTLQHLTTPSSFITGTWEYDLQYPILPSNSPQFHPFSDAIGYGATENGYSIRWESNNYIYLGRLTTGGNTAIITTSVARDTSQHTLKATRDGSGNWEIFIDTVSKGTVLDNTHTTANYLQIVSTATQTIECDNLKVY